ncbi:hypothetical protein ACB098_10G080700 [Castanea mollissima]
MEGRSGNDNPWDSMSMSVDGKANKASPVPEDYPTQHFFSADGKCGNPTNALPLPQWIQTPQLSHNYVEYLAESSRFLPKATTEGLLESIPSSVGGIQAVVEGVSEIQNDILYNKFGEAPASEPSGSFHDINVSKAWFLRPHDDGETLNRFTSTQYKIRAQNAVKNENSWPPELMRENSNVHQPDPGVMVTAPGFLSKPRHSAPKTKAMMTDRQRRLRISERLSALQELLPHSAEGGQASVLDDIIDYVKYLELYMQELGRSRLGGESSTESFIFLEGYGHYISKQILNEPLEEMMGKLLEENPAAAAQLLESKGLFMMPINLVEGLQQAK